MSFPSRGIMNSAFQAITFQQYLKSCAFDLDDYLQAMEQLNRTLFESSRDPLSFDARMHSRRLLQIRNWLGMFEVYNDISPLHIGERCVDQIEVFLETVTGCIQQYQDCDGCEKVLRVMLSVQTELIILRNAVDTSASRSS